MTDETTSMTKPSIDSAENAVQGLARFPILRGTIRFGKVVAVGLSLVVAVLIYTLSSASLGGLSALLGLGVGLLVLVVVLGVVELVKLITEFLMPE